MEYVIVEQNIKGVLKVNLTKLNNSTRCSPAQHRPMHVHAPEHPGRFI